MAFLRLFLPWLFALSLSSCVSLNNLGSLDGSVQKLFASAQYQKALETVQKKNDKRSLVLSFVLKARIYAQINEDKKSFKLYEEAKRLDDEYNATSISDTALQSTVNEGFVKYTLKPFERALLYFYQMLSDTKRGDWSAAAIEARQFITYSKRYPKHERWYGALAATHFISAHIFENQGEFEDALVSYRLAYRLAKHAKIGEKLNLSLFELPYASMLYHLQRQNELKKIQTHFSDECLKTFSKSKRGLLIQNLGLVSKKGFISISRTIEYKDRDGVNRGRLVSFSIPFYTGKKEVPKEEVFESKKGVCPSSALSGRLLDVDALARAQLNHELPLLIAKSMSRIISRNAIARNTGGGAVGAIFTTFAALVDTPDNRSWFLLPSQIYANELFLTNPKENKGLTFFEHQVN